MSASFLLYTSIMHTLTLITLAIVFLQIPVTKAEANDTDSEAFDRNAIVAVKVKGAEDFCSGVVVAPNEILTATHCVYNLRDKEYFPVTSIQIGFGENLFDEHFLWVDVKAIMNNPLSEIKTVSDFVNNDVIRLTTNVSLSAKPLQIASTLEPASALYAWGFGEDQWGYYGQKKSRPLEEKFIETHTIAFSAGACRGDSGGPVLDDNSQIVGIVSMSLVRHCVEEGRRIAQRVK